MSINKTFKEFQNQFFPTLEDCLADYFLTFRYDSKIDKDDVISSILSANGFVHGIDISEYGSLGYEQVNPDWVYAWLKEKGFKEYDRNNFVLTDSKNLPVARVCLNFPITTNPHFSFKGSRELLVDFIKASIPNFKPIEIDDNCIESIELQGFSDKGQPHFKTTKLDHMYDLHDEFYPYLQGGFEELIKDFLLSEESVLILGGTPGTGKTAGVRETCIKLGLRPIVSQDAHAVTHPNFINTIFDIHKKMFDEHNPKKEEEYRCEPYEEMNKDILLKNYLPKVVRGGNKSETEVSRGVTRSSIQIDRIPLSYVHAVNDRQTEVKTEGPGLPIIFVEDADDVLAKLKDGNKLMQNLRNRTDGFSKSEVPTKIIFTTNHETPDFIDEALLRDGRCYGFFPFRKLTPEEAIVARKVCGLPDFEEIPETSVCLATALRKPRKKIFLDKTTGKFGFTKH